MTTPTITKQTVLDTLSGGTRYLIVEKLIKNGPMAVQDITAAMKMEHSAISHQLGFMQRCDILSCRKKGRHVIYQIAKSEAGKLTRTIMRL